MARLYIASPALYPTTRLIQQPLIVSTDVAESFFHQLILTTLP